MSKSKGEFLTVSLLESKGYNVLSTDLINRGYGIVDNDSNFLNGKYYQHTKYNGDILTIKFRPNVFSPDLYNKDGRNLASSLISLNHDLNALFSKVYEQAQAAGGAAGMNPEDFANAAGGATNESNDDNVVDGDYKEI